MPLGRTFALSSGVKIPAIGLGTWQSKPNEVREAVKIALNTGYRHIDGAWIYGNEKEVGQGIKDSGVDRKDIFLTTKLWNSMHSAENVEKAITESLTNLQVDYVDLYLIHWPFSFDSNNKLAANQVPIKETWQAMEKIVKEGKAKSIGVSNFNTVRLKELLSIAAILPAVNQVELHPYLPQFELKEFCDKHNIHLSAYSPLGSTDAPLAKDEVIQEIAKKHNKSEAQVLISWGTQRGTSVLPKSVTPDRIQSNFEDFELPEEDMKRINELTIKDKSKLKRVCDPQNFWKFTCFEEP